MNRVPGQKQPWRGLVALAVLLSMGFLGSLFIGRPSQASARKPNVILFYVDDLGWADVGCYGNPFNETPNIDRLAEQGMKFTDAYAACPVCSPSRAAILTGKYPAHLNLTDFIPGHSKPWAKLTVPQFNQQLPLDEVTIAEELKAQGYATASMGKWHLGGPDFYPDKQGFDLSLVTGGRHFGYRVNPPFRAREGEYLADRLTVEALNFIEENRRRPFFLYLSHYAVHIPLQAPQRLVDKYEAKAEGTFPRNHPTYGAMLESVDESLGRLMAKLKALRLARNTVVIFTSDNGGLILHFRGEGPVVTSNQPLRDEKGTLYEGGIRVPMIVRWPDRVEAGSVCSTPVSGVDILPTIREIVTHSDEGRAVDGRSLVPLLRGRRRLRQRPIFWHYPHYHHSTPAGAVRQGDYKLIEFYEDGRLELYNLAEDIGEQRNLAGNMPRRAARLRRTFREWRRSVNAQMPRPNPNYDPARADDWAPRRRPTPAQRQ